MANVTECIEKLVVSGAVPRKIADEALETFKRKSNEFSSERGPASAEAAAAMEAAKKMSDKAIEKQVQIAHNIKSWQALEAFTDVAGADRNDRVMSTMTKSARGEGIKFDNIEYKGRVIEDKLHAFLGKAMESFKGTFFADSQLLQSSTNFIRELHGVDTGDALAKSVADGFRKMSDFAVARAKAAGKVFNELENWRIFQHWQPSRVAQFTQDEYVRDHLNQIASGGLKLWDKENNRYAFAQDYSEILKKAWSDIKTQGGDDGPFSKNMRTFEFQPGEEGAKSYLALQRKYGVGNEIMGAVDQHVKNMARTIALHEVYGSNPDATFEALMRKVGEGPGSTLPRGLRWLDSERALRLTYDNVAGRGHPVANEFWARFGAGVRDVVGVASLRNLPITIIPGDFVMSFLSAAHNGMSGFDIISHVFDGTLTREVAQHLQVSANAYGDYAANTIRRYEDQINVSGLVRKVSRQIVKATGADWWTTNGRLGAQISYLHMLQDATSKSWAQLDPNLRDNFLARYGFTETDWDKMRKVAPWVASNGAKYLDVTAIDQRLSERLMGAIKEQSAFAFHQPDARTQALMRQGAQAGSFGGEMMMGLGQYKQFTLERLTTHLTRIFTDGPVESRIGRGLAFVAGSIAAGAVSLQAAQIVAGKDPMDMKSPKFWIDAFAKGGAGSIYGELLGNALRGSDPATLAKQFMGPVPGMGADIFSAAMSPFRHALDESGQPVKEGRFAREALRAIQLHSPSTWYTKAAMDRMLWDKLQILLDPNYRESFRRAEQNAAKQNQGFWWGPGETTPTRAPDLSTVYSR